MKTPNLKRLLSLSLTLMIVIALSPVLLTGCGGSDAAEKKPSKTKKSKSQKKKESVDEADESKPEAKEEAEKPKNSGTDDKKEKESKSNPKAEKIWQNLIKGNEQFVAGKHSSEGLITIRKQLADGQKPDVIILGCADSRVPPELVFNKNLGELFVVRVAGNIANPISLGSIEYAVEHLNSKVLVILGHENCGAVGAAVANEEMPTRNLAAIVNKIRPALDGSKSCPLGGKMNTSCVELNARKSAENVVKESPIIKKAVAEGQLTIIQAVYQMETGKVVRLK